MTGLLPEVLNIEDLIKEVATFDSKNRKFFLKKCKFLLKVLSILNYLNYIFYLIVFFYFI